MMKIFIFLGLFLFVPFAYALEDPVLPTFTDILDNPLIKYEGFGVGEPLQYLRITSSGDDLEWVTINFNDTVTINSITGSAGKLLYGLDNATGIWTQATISNKLLDGSNHTDTVSQDPTRGSLIYSDSTPKWNELIIGSNGQVLTSNGTDPSWQTPSGSTARESDVAFWQTDKTWVNIGTTFVNVYTTGIGDPVRIDTNGKTTASFIIDWTKVGVGTQTCQIVSTTNGAIVLIRMSSVVSGLNTNATQDIPTNAENRIDTFKPQCLSTTSTDDPVWLSGQVLLR